MKPLTQLLAPIRERVNDSSTDREMIQLTKLLQVVAVLDGVLSRTVACMNCGECAKMAREARAKAMEILK